MRKPLLITAGTVVALGLAAVLALAAVLREHTIEGTPFDTPVATRHDLRTVASTTVFFAHQSVGYNMVDALPKVYGDDGVPVPQVVESRSEPEGPGLVHTKIGRNGDPLGKIADFDAIMRGGMANAVDVAVLKLCYVDFHEGTDVEPIFASYRDTLRALQRDYPDTAFVAATVPLTTQRGPLGKVKGALGRGDNLGPEHNVVRERYNSLIRAEFTAPGALFDIAAVQSTTPDGDRVAYTYDGNPYYAMDTEYASDPGHLNAHGASVVTSAFVSVLADAVS